MPPRIPLFQCLRVQNACPSASCRTFTTTSASQASTVTQRKRKHDPYAIAQAKARKAANLSRQEVLKKERASTLGDPVRGVTTPFVQSFDTALPPEPAAPTPSTQTRVDASPAEGAPGPEAETDEHLNFFLNKSELDEGVERSKYLSAPTPTDNDFDDPTSPLSPEEKEAALTSEQQTASEALKRIASLSLGSSKDRLRINIQRCISTFGRHNTDKHLPPPPNAKAEAQTMQQYNELRQSESQTAPFPRIGADTGSSEVQIAILTAKIRTLNEFLRTRGRTDKVNKRNLRLLVHRRQKLLQYLRRKDKGGARWQHCIETLGLTEGTWKGEISL